jgi:hypothetical protein
MAIQALAVTAPFAVLAAGKPWCELFLIEIFGLAFTIAYCRNFLYERLICLGDGNDVDAVGVVLHISPPPPFTKFDWDNDYSINLLLGCTPLNEKQAEAENEEPYGYLIKPQPEILALQPETPGYPPEGYHIYDKVTDTDSATLHAEFEGAGNYQLMQMAQGMMGFAIAAIFACVFLPFPADVIVSLGLGFLALLGFLLGAIVSKFARPGSPSDVNPEINSLQTMTGPGENNQGVGADVVYIRGTWVYDPLHSGWNEIHPIKVCTSMGKWNGDWSIQCNNDIILRLRKAFQDAQSDETRGNQSRPEHQWQVHPSLDGCDPGIIL